MTITRPPRSMRALMALLAAGALVAAAAPALAQNHQGGCRAGLTEIAVDADDDLSDADVRAIGASIGVALKLNSIHSDDANLYIGAVPTREVDRVLAALNATDGVEGAEVNATVSLTPGLLDSPRDDDGDAPSPGDFPNDPLYQYQWHFDQINMAKAWPVATGKDVVVAVIDTGVAYADSKDGRFKQAPDLKGTGMVPGYDFVADDDEAVDEHGHGTHVAGTIAQTTNNAYGVAGVAYNAKIMPLRVLNAQGYGSVSDIADSIRFAADNGAKVINMSLGGPLPSFTMRSAVRYAHSKGVTIVAAAGNSGRRMKSYPAAYKHVIAVAATQYDRKTTFYSQWGDFVDIAAPGGNTRVDQNGDGRPDGVMQETIKPGDGTKHDFALYMGTSMASPHVAGVAALLVGMGVNNPDQVEAILKNTASTEGQDEPSKDWRERYGAGLMDAAAAVRHTSGCFGLGRSGLAMLLAVFLILGVRRRDTLGMTTLDADGKGSRLPFGLGLVMASSGLFFLPALLSFLGLHSEALAFGAQVLGQPLAKLDTTLLGPAFHQNPLLASALIPMLLLAFGLGQKHLRALAAGVAIGFAGFLFAEAWFLTSDIQWIPGVGFLDRAWLVVNGVISLVLGRLTLKRY